MTALVSIRCDTERDDSSFCLGATVTNGPTTAAWLEASALRRGWSRVGERHYCPTCTQRRAAWRCICGSGDDGEWHSLMCVASNTPDEEWYGDYPARECDHENGECHDIEHQR